MDQLANLSPYKKGAYEECIHLMKKSEKPMLVIKQSNLNLD